MAIVGLTVSETGEPIQRLAVSTKVSIGEVKKAANGKTYPSKLDHFAFLRKSKELGWETDPELTEYYGKECREFKVFFMSDDLESVFRTELAWWSATEKVCWGDGRAATRRTEKHPQGEHWSPCGRECPNFDEECGPSGDLYFRLVDFPRIGATCRIHTKGKRSVQQIYSALTELQTITGGRLAGIQAKLIVRPEKAAYYDEKEKKKKSTVIYALNLELDRKDSMEKLIENMTETSRLFERTQKLLGGGRVVIEEEPEAERAPDIATEFYPSAEAAEAAEKAERVQQPARASSVRGDALKPETGAAATATAVAEPEQLPINGIQCITTEQRREFVKVCAEAGWTNEQVKELLRDRWGVSGTAQIPSVIFEEIKARFASGTMSTFTATDEDLPENMR